METYQIKVIDLTGKARRFTIVKDVPCQKFERDGWTITVTRIKRNNGLYIDQLEWQRK